MKNGLYKVDFRTPLGAGSGVVVLNQGSFLGGDSGLSYIGNYQINGDKFTGTAQTKRHTAIPNLVSVFGRDEVTIALAGTISGDTAVVSGTSPQAPGITFNCTLVLLHG